MTCFLRFHQSFPLPQFGLYLSLLLLLCPAQFLFFFTTPRDMFDFPDQLSNLRPLQWKLGHQGSPCSVFILIMGLVLEGSLGGSVFRVHGDYVG